MATWWQQPFFQVALPIMLTMLLGYLWQDKRFDDMNRRFDDVNRRIDNVIEELREIHRTLKEHGERIVRLEERLSPISRR